MNKYTRLPKKLQTPETQTGSLYYSCVYDELAVKIGLNEALFLYKLHVLCYQSRNIKDGFQWVYNSAPEWKEKYFPYWGLNTIRRIISSLEKKNLIIIGEYNKKSYDKTSWFRVNYSELQLLVPSIVSIWVHPFTQNGYIDLPKMGRPIPHKNNKKKEEEKTAEKTIGKKDSQEEKREVLPHGLPAPHSLFNSQAEIKSFALGLNSLLTVKGVELTLIQRNKFPYLTQLDIYNIAKETNSDPSRVKKSYQEFMTSLAHGNDYHAIDTRDGVIKFVTASKKKEMNQLPEQWGVDVSGHPDHQQVLKNKIESSHPINILKEKLNCELVSIMGDKNLESDVYKRMSQLDELGGVENYESLLIPF